MCTTDAFQGFKKMTHFPTVALAVSQSNKYVEGKVYDAPARMIAKTGSPLLPTAESLKGKSIGVEQGTTQETYAKA
jgi:ABC-type amino acid transport substrate-binding protein